VSIASKSNHKAIAGRILTVPLILAVPPFQGSIYVVAQKQPGKGAVVES
jgi:hypothetical protein